MLAPLETDAIDPADVPYVAAKDLALPVRLMLASGGSGPLRALTESEIKRIEHFYWRRSNAGRTHKVAVLLRFRSLIDVLATRRLDTMLAARGSEALRPILEIAAALRLNAKWGFNPQRFATALAASRQEAGPAREERLAIAA
jgi:hypothetical protein